MNHSEAWLSQSFRTRVLHEVTALDERKRQTDKHWNPYFLGIVCRDALPAIDEAIASGATEAEAFVDAFTPSREMHKVARNLGLPLDVDRGKWIKALNAPEPYEPHTWTRPAAS